MVEEKVYSGVALLLAHFKPAERFKNIKPSGTRRFFALAQRMPDVINLGIGEPDFTTPKHVLDAAEKTAKGGKTHYTPTNGIPALRKVLARKANIEYGLTYDYESEIMSLLVEPKQFSWR